MGVSAGGSEGAVKARPAKVYKQKIDMKDPA